MNTSNNTHTAAFSAKSVRFLGNLLCIRLNDNRELRMSLDDIAWLQWLRDATPRQRANWSLEPGGFAIYWDDLDDGIEITHILNLPTTVSSPPETATWASELEPARVA